MVYLENPIIRTKMMSLRRLQGRARNFVLFLRNSVRLTTDVLLTEIDVFADSRNFEIKIRTPCRQLDTYKARKKILTKRYYASILGLLVSIVLLHWSWQFVRKSNILLSRHRFEHKGLSGSILNLYIILYSPTFLTSKSFQNLRTHGPSRLFVE